MKDKILVVEKTASASRIGHVLDELGLYTHVHISGVEQKHPVDGILRVFDYRHERAEIKLDEYVVALLDGILFGHVHVWELIPVLKAEGIECVGISNMFWDLLQRSGATVSADRLSVHAYLRKDLPAIYAAARERKLIRV